MRFAVLPIVLATIPIFGALGMARADDGIYPIVASGSWAAAEHRPKMTEPPDVCLASNAAKGLVFQSDGSGVQLQFSNTQWSLPPGVMGSITVSVGTWKNTFKIDYNSAVTIGATLPPSELTTLISAMDDAPTMLVTVGKAQPTAVALGGSAKATDAFLTCLGIYRNSKRPGTNPFE